MPDLTMGQRIAERRRLLNLSQEALGEKMGVSRQAISKWEADAAIPEIDKLIVMSRLFSVSVGWLLGTEPEAPAEQGESFTEQQLRLVEEIVKRYHQPPANNKSFQKSIAIGVLMFLLISIGAAALIGNYVNQELGSIWAAVNGVYANNSHIQNALEEVSSRLDRLAQGEQLLSEYALEAVAWADMTGATVRFTAIPKRTGAGEQAWLSVRRNGEEVANAMCVMDGSAYTATVDLPAADGYTYYFLAVQTGGDSSQQKLTQVDAACEDLLRALNGTVFYDLTGWHYSYKEDTFGAELLVTPSDPLLFREGVDAAWSRIDLVVLLNGVEIERKSYLEAISSGSVEVHYEYNAADMGDADTLTLQLECSFGDNLSTVQPVLDFQKEDGEPKITEYAMLAE